MLAVREAEGFWNTTLGKKKAAVRLGPAVAAISTTARRAVYMRSAEHFALGASRPNSASATTITPYTNTIALASV